MTKPWIMKTAGLAIVTAVLALFVLRFPMNHRKLSDQELRLRMDFSKPIDPAVVYTVPDAEFSYGLSSTLVDLDGSKQIQAGLASHWKMTDEHTYRFTLRKNALWSNGTPLSSSDVKRSFDRMQKLHGENLKGLFGILKSITPVNDSEIDFSLMIPAATAGLLMKLTEPMYGVTFVKTDGNLNLGISSGPFVLVESTDTTVVLQDNPLWHKHSLDMPHKIIIQRSLDTEDPQTALLHDDWANISESCSLMTETLSQKYSEMDDIQLWKRSVDRAFTLALNRRLANPTGYGLIRHLSKNLDRNIIMEGLTGFTLGNQLFPNGYALNDPEFPEPADFPLPEVYSKKPLVILYSPARVSEKLKTNLETALTRVTGIKPIFRSVSLAALQSHTKEGNYDLYAGSVGVSDPNYEGAMSYLFEFDPPLIPSGNEPYREEIHKARTLKNKEKIGALRTILSDSTRKGHILPLFHYSSVVISRKGINLSGLPITDESLNFAGVRFD